MYHFHAWYAQITASPVSFHTSRSRRTVETSPRTERFNEEGHPILDTLLSPFKVVHFECISYLVCASDQSFRRAKVSNCFAARCAAQYPYCAARHSLNAVRCSFKNLTVNLKNSAARLTVCAARYIQCTARHTFLVKM